jgi:hypothetical protein
MNISEMQTVAGQVGFSDYDFLVLESAHGFSYLQAAYYEPDTVTGVVGRQYTRRWLLSPEMTKNEIVSTAFKCVLTSMEHKTREWFLYRGRAIYQPHYDVDALYEICEQREVRA